MNSNNTAFVNFVSLPLLVLRASISAWLTNPLPLLVLRVCMEGRFTLVVVGQNILLLLVSLVVVGQNILLSLVVVGQNIMLLLVSRPTIFVIVGLPSPLLVLRVSKAHGSPSGASVPTLIWFKRPAWTSQISTCAF
jgi:hypothetical protein